MWSLIILTIYCFGMVIPQSTPTPPICLLPASSPQFAEICRLPNLTAPLSSINATLYAKYANLSANLVCDLDCRCVMGASARGGKCDTPKGKDGAFCVCDYERAPPIDPPAIEIDCLSYNNIGNPQLVSILCPATQLMPPFGLCNSDCICSHGYPNTGTHTCTKQNGDPNNTVNTYCVCGNATNLETESS